MMYSFITSGLESEIFISNNLQDDANAAGQGPHFENCCGCEVTGMLSALLVVEVHMITIN